MILILINILIFIVVANNCPIYSTAEGDVEDGPSIVTLVNNWFLLKFKWNLNPITNYGYARTSINFTTLRENVISVCKWKEESRKYINFHKNGEPEKIFGQRQIQFDVTLGSEVWTAM